MTEEAIGWDWLANPTTVEEIHQDSYVSLSLIKLGAFVIGSGELHLRSTTLRFDKRWPKPGDKPSYVAGLQEWDWQAQSVRFIPGLMEMVYNARYLPFRGLYSPGHGVSGDTCVTGYEPVWDEDFILKGRGTGPLRIYSWGGGDTDDSKGG